MPPPRDGVLAGLIFCRSCLGNSNSCDLTRAMTLHVPTIAFQRWSSLTSGSYRLSDTSSAMFPELCVCVASVSLFINRHSLHREYSLMGAGGCTNLCA